MRFKETKDILEKLGLDALGMREQLPPVGICAKHSELQPVGTSSSLVGDDSCIVCLTKAPGYEAFCESVKNKNYDDVRSRLTPENLDLLHAALGIAGESGEIVDPIKKVILYGKPLDREAMLEEAGDVLYYMAILLNTLGSSFDEVMHMNQAKLNKRYSGGYSDKAAVERKDKA